MQNIEFQTIYITLRLAFYTVIVLFLIGIPISLWLTYSNSKFKYIVQTIIALPLVLPPTVLGFYLLILFNPEGFIGLNFYYFTGERLVFSFIGLVIASVIYSLPFVIQPLHAAFENIDFKDIEAARNLGASKISVFINIIIPLSLRGFLVSGVLGFAHTIGEFGIVLMVGGNISGETRVLSIAIFEKVETLKYFDAHILSGGLLLFSFLTLLLLYMSNKNYKLKIFLK
ncbi:MAG: Molybdenum transport system permease protein ModB [Alphaproteobacteria bacterium MarineAlpha2_Bin1]|nr:MAG: Molybdenum transport system permease protein ModB [Alphaproteobacteria bacterium MarineAlpha2_Bin1]|tara:strand:- start:501 stop:1184 length:684 start_codon:yes stop_codon:yes gene_type:complete